MFCFTERCPQIHYTKAADIHIILKFSSHVPIHLIQLQAPWKTRLLLDKCYGWRKKRERFHALSNQKHTASISQSKTAPKGLESLKRALKIHRRSLQLHSAADSCMGCRSPTSGDLHQVKLLTCHSRSHLHYQQAARMM